MIAQCVSCQGRFTAKRAHAKYCSERCRKRVQRGSTQPPLPPGRQNSAPLVAIAPLTADGADDEGTFASVTRRKLEAVGRLEDYRGIAAMYIAKVLDASPQETGTGHSALVNTYVARMEAALDGANAQESAVEALRRRAQGRVGAA